MKKNLLDEKEVWTRFGKEQKVVEPFPIGPHFSYQLRHTPRHVLFTLARYKFAARLIGPRKTILELGCSDGLGTYYLAETAQSVCGVDFDEEAIAHAQQYYQNERLRFSQADFLGKKFGGYDAVVSYDVIEHIFSRNERAYLRTIAANLKPQGVAFIGTPNILAQKYSNRKTRAAHVNMFSHERLQALCGEFFHNVFVFGQNDELVHTGYLPMAHYLLAVCCQKKLKKK
ncbi:MAG: class I SAM-dependent methyltransferase [Verrucomicrobiae bacterium]|nr:class I SAM-dependent methyltransferase [Verrucomicrobiae bacterium]